MAAEQARASEASAAGEAALKMLSALIDDVLDRMAEDFNSDDPGASSPGCL